MLKKRIWRGFVGIFSVILTISLCGSIMLWDHAAEVNNVLGTSSSKIIESNGVSNEVVDNIYYKSDFNSLKDVQDASRVHSVETAEEGSVLLKNNGVLPFKNTIKNITLLGRSSYDTIYRNSSAGVPTGDDLVTLNSAFESKGININKTVYRAYTSSETSRFISQKQTESNIGEESINFYTNEIISSFSDYNDMAVIVLSRGAGEGNDCTVSDIDGISQLALHKDEINLLKLAKQYFNKVVVLINSGNAMELGWLDTYNVDACLWIGTPGNYGCEGVVNLLTGASNPSGKLTDSYATNSFSSAAAQNMGSISWNNSRDLKLGPISRKSLDTTSKYIVQAEGIYVGYKYYETRYEDTILGEGDASGNYGIFSSSGGKWNYADEIAYPFGYGLSYTSFEQVLESVSFNENEKKYTATVKVTNTGSKYSGKSVVQLYFQSPYTQYDKDNLVEKSAIQLVGFNKTKSLVPGESATILIDVDEYLMASYDYKGYESYILDAGDYYFSIGEDSHDALNNILAAKKATGMYNQFGINVNGDATKTFKFIYNNLDSETFSLSYSGVKIENQMQTADINYWLNGSVKYLTRQNWATFPKNLELDATEEMAAILKANNQSKVQVNEMYKSSDYSMSVRDITTGKNNNISFIDMYKVDWNNTDKWNSLLDQLTIDDLISITDGGAAVSISMPQPVQTDGPDGAGGVQFCGQIVASSSFNPELLRIRGDLLAELDGWSGASARWAPGGNLHRTPFSGRNFEYFSEDSYFSYLAEIIMCNAMQKKGVIAAPKHFAGNDQESNRRGVGIFTNEQAWREGAFKGFEGAFTKGGALGTMTSYSRYGLIFTNESIPAQINILRGEWGFKGYTITDFGSGSTADMFTSGTVQSGGSSRVEELNTYIKENDEGYILQSLKDNAKYHIYAFIHSNLINGLSNNTIIENIMPWWKKLIIFIDVIFGIATIFTFVFYIISGYLKKGSSKDV